MKTLTKSGDWDLIDFELTRMMNRMGPTEHRKQARQVLNNIDIAVRELAQLEVVARRSKTPKLLDGSLQKINIQISWLESELFLNILKGETCDS